MITKIADFKEEGLVSQEIREGKKGILKCAKGKSIEHYTNCVQLKTIRPLSLWSKFHAKHLFMCYLFLLCSNNVFPLNANEFWLRTVSYVVHRPNSLTHIL